MFEKIMSTIMNSGMTVASEKFSKYILKIDPYNKVYNYICDMYLNNPDKALFIDEINTTLFRPIKYCKIDKYNYIILITYINYLIPKDIEVSDDFEKVYSYDEDADGYICKINRPKDFYKYYNYMDCVTTRLWVVGLNPEAKLQEIIRKGDIKHDLTKNNIYPTIYHDGKYTNTGRNKYKYIYNMINNLSIDCIPDGLFEMRNFIVGKLNDVFKILIVDNGGHCINDITIKIASKLEIYVIDNITKVNSVISSKINGLYVLNNVNEWAPSVLKYIEDVEICDNLTKTVVETVNDINLLSKEQLDSYHVIIYSNLLSRKDAEKYCDYYKVGHKILDLIKFPIDIKILNKYILNTVSTRQ